MDQEDQKSRPFFRPGSGPDPGGLATGKPAPKPVAARRSVTARSRTTNGRDIVPGIDGRSAFARRWRDVYAAITADRGGVERLSEVQQQLIRQFTTISVQAEQATARLINGEPVDAEQLCQQAGTLVKLSQRIGLTRVAKQVPSLHEYLAQKATAQPSDADTIDIEAEPA
jgi:hypothetical protein